MVLSSKVIKAFFPSKTTDHEVSGKNKAMSVVINKTFMQNPYLIVNLFNDTYLNRWPQGEPRSLSYLAVGRVIVQKK